MVGLGLKLLRICLLALMLLFVPLILAPSSWCLDFTATITQDVFNTQFTGRIQVSNDRYRMTLHPPEVGQEQSLTVIVDRQKGSTILLPPKSQTYEEIENFTPRAYMVDPFQSISNMKKIARKKMVGEKTVAGFACEHYAYYDQDFKLADVWYTEKLQSFPIKAQMVSGRKDGDVNISTNIGDTKVELSHIKFEPVDEVMFALPTGAVKKQAQGKEKQKAPVVTRTLEGISPWGRRIGKGGEIRVKTDPTRPVKITLAYLTDDAVATCTAIPEGKAPNEAESIRKEHPEKGKYRKFTIDKHKKTDQVIVRVDEGMIFARIINEEDPFSFGNDRKIKEGYLTVKELQGIVTDPSRKLTVSVTGDNQDGPDSEVSLMGYRKPYEDKIFEQKVQILNDKTQIWDFSPDVLPYFRVGIEIRRA